jgi:hypothetical protein
MKSMDGKQRRWATAWAWALLAPCAGCALPAGDELIAAHSQPLIYGSDDRMDVFEHPDAALRELARTSVLAIMPRTSVAASSGHPTLTATPSAASLGLCPGERFAEQPVVATCSAVLIDRDLVLTASHCLGAGASTEVACDDQVYVFDYHYSAPATLAQLSADSIFGCRDILVRGHGTQSDGGRLDFAIVQLDRPVPDDRIPLSVAARAADDGERLATIGFPLGQPAKIDSNAQVVDARASRTDSFVLRTDAFEGSSGSAVIDAQLELLGVLYAGGTDFTPSEAGCSLPQTVVDGEVPVAWERAVRAEHALAALCASEARRASLCDDGADALDSARTAQSASCAVRAAERSSQRPLLSLGLIGAFAIARRCSRRAARMRVRESIPSRQRGAHT